MNGFVGLLLFVGGLLTALAAFVGPGKLLAKLLDTLTSTLLKHTTVLTGLASSITDLSENVHKLDSRMQHIEEMMETK